MSTHVIVNVASLCVVLACAETLHGIARIRLLVPRLGKARAVKLSAFTGSLLAFVICAWLVPPIGLDGVGPHLTLGLVLAVFMAGFDIAIGRLLMRKAWSRIWPDFDPRTGNYLLFGLMALSVTPVAVWWLLGLSRHTAA